MVEASEDRGLPDDAPGPSDRTDGVPSPPRLRTLRSMTHLMDEALEIPGLGIRVGLDPLLGLLPGLGDVVGGLLTGWIVVEGVRLGAGVSVVLHMLGNLVVDIVLGSLPVAGDLFDVTWRANARNLRLLETSLADQEAARRRSRLVVGAAAAGVLGVVGGTTLLVAWGFRWLLGLL